MNSPMDELRDYFTNRLTWLGVQYPDRAVTELLSRVEQYATDRAAAELRAAGDDIPRFSPAVIAKWLRDRAAGPDRREGVSVKALAWLFDHLPFFACVAVGIAVGIQGKPELGVGLLALGSLTEIAGAVSELRRDVKALRESRDSEAAR